MFAQLGQKCVVILKAHHDIKRQILFTRRKADQRPVSFMSTRVLVVIAAKPDDRRPPHLWFTTRDLLHDLRDRETVFATCWVSDLVQKTCDALFSRFSFGLG